MIKRKENGKWLLNVQVGGRLGKRIKKVFSTQREAKEYELWLRSHNSKNLEWQPPKKDTRRLSDLVQIWWAAHGYALAAGKDTLRRLQSICESLGDPIASNFSSKDFAQYRTQRAENGTSLSTLNREHAYLRSVFFELIRLGEWKNDNPLKHLRQFKIQERELSYLSKEQIAILLNSLEKSQNSHVMLITKICLSTGCRWGEAEKLKITQVRHGIIQFAETKSKKARAVPISKNLEREILTHHQKFPGSEKLFASAHAAFVYGLERAKIKLPKGQAAHVLRHTFASHFMMAGGNILALQRVLGHSDLKMTMRYSHLSPEHLQEVVRLNPLSPG